MVRAELLRLALIEEGDEYLPDLVDEVGEPTPDKWARANAVAHSSPAVVWLVARADLGVLVLVSVATGNCPLAATTLCG